jgi:ABC-type multidrug transport system ATPase subunit
MHSLDVSAVGKTYRGGATALEDVSFNLKNGIVGLVGPNGAGKSSLMRILATVARPSAGTVHWDGIDIVRTPRALRTMLGYLPQDAGVYPHLDAREFLGYIAALKGLDARRTRVQTDDLIESLDLAPVARRPLGTLSGGNRQRVAIASALLGDPQLLIVDEPTVGLDPEQRIRFRDLISALGRDRIVLLSTHIVSDLESSADRILVMARGRIVADGTRADVVGAHASLEAAYLAHIGKVA